MDRPIGAGEIEALRRVSDRHPKAHLVYKPLGGGRVADVDPERDKFHRWHLGLPPEADLWWWNDQRKTYRVTRLGTHTRCPQNPDAATFPYLVMERKSDSEPFFSWHVALYPHGTSARIELLWDPAAREPSVVLAFRGDWSDAASRVARVTLDRFRLDEARPGPPPEGPAQAQAKILAAIEGLADPEHEVSRSGRLPTRHDLAGQLMVTADAVDKLLRRAGWSMTRVKDLYRQAYTEMSQ
jgi:hypothetical protein